MRELLESVLVLSQVVFIDLVLAGDNAVVVGMAAARLQGHERAKAIAIGIGAATLLRISFAIFASVLLQFVGLLLAGGLLLLWVCWKMWRELHGPDAPQEPHLMPVKTLRQAVVQIVAADVSMSIDNVLAVAGAAHEHPAIMAMGLALSVVLTGLAAAMIARLLQRHRWIAYVGLFIILAVAAGMIFRGAMDTGHMMWGMMV